MTSRCSRLPCSRSRSTAAPLRKIARTEILLMIALMATNQPCSMLGVKRALVSNCVIGASLRLPRPCQNGLIVFVLFCWLLFGLFFVCFLVVVLLLFFFLC